MVQRKNHHAPRWLASSSESSPLRKSLLARGSPLLVGAIVCDPRALRRSAWMAAEGGRVVMHVPLVVYNGRAEWNAPLQPDERRVGAAGTAHLAAAPRLPAH